MRKTQVALAALALVASTAALAADVTVSGVMDWGVQNASAPDAAKLGGTDGDLTGATSRTSVKTSNLSPQWLIISADEDLGNGLKVNGTYQGAIGLSSSNLGTSGGYGSKGDFIALGQKVTVSHDQFGSVTIGDWLDPFFLAAAGHSAGTDGGSNIGGILNPLFASPAAGFKSSTGAWERSMVIYNAPSVMGVSGSYARKFGGAPGSNAAGSFDSLSLNYSAQGLSATYAYKRIGGAETLDADGALDPNADYTGKKATNTLMAIGYDFGVAKANLMSIENKQDFLAAGDKLKTTGINVTVPYEAWTLSASYYRSNLTSATSGKGETYVLAAHYALSKRTKLYVNYQTLKNTDATVYDLNTGGNGGDVYSNITGTASATTVGVRHSF
jgi:predicted porin